MLSVLLLALLVTAAAVAFGVPLLRAFDPAPPRFLAAALAGFAVLAALATAVGLLAPLGGPAARGGVFGLAALAALAGRGPLARALARWRGEVRAIGAPALILGAALSLAVLGRAAGRVDSYDAGLYHAQAIRWAEELPAVPGLANLHERLGYSPGWFPAAALVTMREQPGAPHRPLGAALALWVVAAAAAAFDRLAKGDRRPGTILAAALGVALVQWLFLWLSAPAPDVGAALLAWGVLVLVLDGADAGFGAAPGSVRAAVVAASVAALFVKLSAAPLLLPAAALALTAPRRRAAAGLAGMAFLLALPHVARNALVTGYPLYPLLQPALDVDWRLPEPAARALFALVRGWARVPFAPADAVLAMPASEWVPRWWATVRAPDRLLLVASAVLLVPGLFLLRRRRAALLAAGTCAAAVVGWFLAAPDPRLAWGFLVPLPLVLAAPLLAAVRRPGPAWLPAALGGAALVVIVLGNSAWLRSRRGNAGWGSAGTPAAYPLEPTRPVVRGALTLRVPESGDRCWDAPLPCTPYPEKAPVARGGTIANGFRAAGVAR